ncbi:hypothetical protein [Phormidium sp. CCY1219]|uniref:hypothetical protein n=1 Tax=Phormidium sp. CCY1219 TaxID=2886104 RepID=UPI002D1F7BF3|nr:hypothetical protein [Phormidium sp. CCY1219]MEB3826624.1 hypothetical protein [Phormidium sp. CCY1219]
MYERSFATLASRSQTARFLKAPPARKNAGWVPMKETQSKRENPTWVWDAIVTHNQTVAQSQLAPAPERQMGVFLAKALQQTLESGGTAQAVYPLLEMNVAQLSDRLGVVLRQSAVSLLPVLSPERAVEFAGVLVDFGGLLWEFPGGNRAHNIEIAIACCETALPMLPCDKAISQAWGETHNNLALGYSDRYCGDRIDNLSSSFAHYQRASQIFIRQPFPRHWTRLHRDRN